MARRKIFINHLSHLLKLHKKKEKKEKEKRKKKFGNVCFLYKHFFNGSVIYNIVYAKFYTNFVSKRKNALYREIKMFERIYRKFIFCDA